MWSNVEGTKREAVYRLLERDLMWASEAGNDRSGPVCGWQVLARLSARDRILALPARAGRFCGATLEAVEDFLVENL